MAKAQECAKLLRAGNNIDSISRELGPSVNSIVNYLLRAVAEGVLSRRELYQLCTCEERERFSQLPGLEAAVEDVFRNIRDLELTLHSVVRDKLMLSYGSNEIGWWRQGIPEEVRIKCQGRRETDPDNPSDPFSYTDLLDLAKIIRKEWKAFQPALSQRYASNRETFMSDMERLNRLRNKIMHPARGYTPTTEDFQFVTEVRSDLGSIFSEE